MGAEACALGHGGIRLVAAAAGVREATVSLGASELESGEEPLGRARRPGGGCKRLAETDPGLVPALLALVEPEERGAPVSPLRWTVKSTRVLAAELTAAGHRVSADTVHKLLKAQGFSLQANAAILHQRFALPARAIAALFGCDRSTIGHELPRIRQLLDDTATTIPPGPVTLATYQDLRDYAAAGITIPALTAHTPSTPR
jgi:Rhodopirellula transposase DDE domain